MKKAVILAAGKGTRMKSKYPKVIHKVCGKEMLNHVIDNSKYSGVDEVIAVLGHKSELVQAVINEDVKTVLQTEQLGTAHAVKMASDYLNKEDTIIVLCGDTPLVETKTIKALFEYHEKNDCMASVLSALANDPKGYGRIIRDDKDELLKIVEQKDASEQERRVKEVNSGIYCFNGEFLISALKEVKNENAQGEYYLPDTLEIIKNKGGKVGVYSGSTIDELMGVNSRVQLSNAEKFMKKRINEKHMDNGVTIIDPENTYIEADVEIGMDTIVLPGCIIQKGSKIGEECTIGPETMIENSVIGDYTEVKKSTMINSKVGNNTKVGPYAYLRPKSNVGDNVKIGDFVEVKNANFGNGSKASHLSYIGDADVGENVNIGCGVVFVNYDGKNKFRSIVKDGAFVGSNANLVAPVVIEEKGFVAAGSTITKNVPKKSLAVARGRQSIKEGWVEKKEAIDKARK